MKHRIAPVKNIRLLTEAGRALQTRAVGVPGIGLVWGATGYGKTTAAAWLANKMDAIYIRANATWTPSAMLGSLMRELDATAKGSCSAMLDFIVEQLGKRGQPVFVDESDYLAGSKRLLETLRDLHDLSSVPVILIGMADFKRRIIHREQLAGRIAQWVEFKPADIEDARILANSVCEVEVADDLLAELHSTAKGSMRGMIVGLARIETFAKRHEKTKMTAKDWGKQQLTLADRGSSEAAN
jgi:DNA transposition AAA+ family ATPase